MKTLKELQAEIEKLQKEEKTLTTLCGFIPEKYAMCFKPTRLDSGYSMGEVVVYICNGKEIYREDNRKYYTGRGSKYKPTHGEILVNFTKKALLEYCKFCYNIRVKEIRKEYKERVEIGQDKREFLKKYISKNSIVKDLYIGL